MIQKISNDTQHIVDAGGVALFLATASEYLPEALAMLGIIWYLMRMYDWIKEKIDVRKRKNCSNKTD